MIHTVPRQRRDALAGRRTERAQTTRQSPASLSELRIRDATDAALAVCADHLRPAMPLGRMVEKLIYRQRISLHRSIHAVIET
jgi:hypothetical protein